MKTKTSKDGSVEIILSQQDRQKLASAADVLSQYAVLCEKDEVSEASQELAGGIRGLLKHHAEKT